MEQVSDPIEWYFQGVSSAMGVYATWKGARQLQEFALVQIQTADGLVRIRGQARKGQPVLRLRHRVAAGGPRIAEAGA